jgi:tRNA1Val (adenine37-N6)-methyltransferase
VFRFKQFSIEDNRCAMKVGTDAVLLGAWVNVKGVKRILDVGTGCGIIALMLAQRTEEDVNIEGIEIEEQDVKQADENLLESRWCNRILFHNYSLQNFRSGYKYDLIVSNPPYFNNSQLPPKAHRAKARHTDLLSHKELLHHSVRLLKTKGRLSVILPFEEGKVFLSLAEEVGLFLNRQMAFYSRKEKLQERWLFEFSFNKKELVREETNQGKGNAYQAKNEIKEETLVLHGEGESWSEDYKKLMKEFYLKL